MTADAPGASATAVIFNSSAETGGKSSPAELLVEQNRTNTSKVKATSSTLTNHRPVRIMLSYEG
jgi:hypothetical protein